MRLHLFFGIQFRMANAILAIPLFFGATAVAYFAFLKEKYSDAMIQAYLKGLVPSS